ncbi:DUF418 domain-containing protein [Saccharopolyspora sp. NPDC047091]|uniref:DUF418 domain-containing protein n=1 Tax=Saccharopolyspora sp. NPDC047091 TaxID=3155924 RepID=UPI0033C82CF3
MSTATEPHPPAPPARPTPLAERAIAPDLARGMMLLLIALAHVPWFLYTAGTGAALLHPAGGGLADRIVQAVTIVVVDARTHTMFAFLFAYGIGQLHARRIAAGATPRAACRLLRTRHLWMFAFGLVHAALLWQGDILATYGLLGLVFVPLFLNRGDRALQVTIGVLLALAALVCAGAALAGPVPSAAGPDAQRLAIAETDYLASVVLRLGNWLPALPAGIVTLALPAAFLLGLLASRHRVLEEPARHLRLLRGTAFAGIAVGWAAGVPLALHHVGVLELPNLALAGAVHFFAGIFAGVGYAALFGLVAHRMSLRGTDPAVPVRMLLALGRRSLSGYLAQSVVFVPLLAAWGFGVGAHLSSWSAALVGLGTWVLTAVLAFAAERAGVRGPAEVLLRGLTYRAPRRRA